MSAQPNLGMQPTTFDNPMGIDGFEFVEFAAPPGQAGQMHAYLRSMGFSAVARHTSRPITRYRQGGVNFLLNEDADSFASDFAAAHGPSACGFAIRFRKPGRDTLYATFRIDETELGLVVGGGQLDDLGEHQLQPLQEGAAVLATEGRVTGADVDEIRAGVRQRPLPPAEEP